MKKKKNSDGFLQIPKMLFTDPLYKSLSAESKLMYGLLLDRESLSEKNGWTDENGRVFLYYTIDEMSKDLGFGHQKTINLFKALEEKGLVRRVKKAPGKPCILYVKRVSKSYSNESQNDTPPSSEAVPDRVSKSYCNNTDINNTDLNNIFFSYERTRERVRDQIEYDCLCESLEQGFVDSVVDLICDTLFSKSRNIHLNDTYYPSELVKSRLLSLNSEHVGYVYELLSRADREVKNISRYMLTLLFNAPSSIDRYFDIRVRSDNNIEN